MLEQVTDRRRRLVGLLVAALGVTAIVLAPTPQGLTLRGQYAVATMFCAGVLWVTRALPLPVTALSVPLLLTTLSVYDRMDPALSGFADPLIFLFVAGFMLANAMQKHGIDRRLALHVIARMGTSPRLLILAIMLSTAFLSMWVSNTATTAMMTPIALGVLAQVVGRDEAIDGEESFSNVQISTLLGTAYAASVGGVGTLIGTPPNAVVVAVLDRSLGYDVSFFDWLFVGLPVVVVTLPLVWYVLTVVVYPPEIADVAEARREAEVLLDAEGAPTPAARRVTYVFGATAALWVVGGLGFLADGVVSEAWAVTLFGGDGPTVLGTTGHRGVLYYVNVGLAAVVALVLLGVVEWEDLADIDWGTILLFGGGISLAEAFAETGATEWVGRTIFGTLVGAPLILVVGIVVLFVVLLTEVTSNTATTTVLAPVLVGLGGILATTLGLEPTQAAVFLAVAGGIAASFAFALPVATPPNAVVFGSGHMRQDHMLRAGIVLNLVMTLVLTALITLLFTFVWPLVLW
jgi:sodium-dependent dicarboxylate transporter 2/3/5